MPRNSGRPSTWRRGSSRGAPTSCLPPLSCRAAGRVWPSRHHGSTLVPTPAVVPGQEGRESVVRIQALGLAALLALAAGDVAAADISGDVVRIGVLNDQSGVAGGHMLRPSRSRSGTMR